MMTLRLTDLRFDAIDHTCVYAVNGTIEYEIYEWRLSSVVSLYWISVNLCGVSKNNSTFAAWLEGKEHEKE